MFRYSLFVILLLLVATACNATATNEFHAVMRDQWAAYLESNPLLATQLGVRQYDAEIGEISLRQMDHDAASAQTFLDKLARIDVASLNSTDQVNYTILRRLLSEGVAGNSYPQRMIVFSTLFSFHQTIAGLADLTPFHEQSDYTHYLDRLSKYPTYSDQAIAVTRAAIKAGAVQPCASLDGFENTITGVVTTDAAKSRFYAPFTTPRPSSVSAADWQALQTRALSLIRTVLDPAYQKWAQIYSLEYLPHCRKDVGISATPQGKAYYAYIVGVMTTTQRTPDDIHALGLREVKRIAASMDNLAKDSGYSSRAAMIEKMHTDPKYFAKTPDEIMAAAARMAKEIDGKMPTLFGRLPRLPYGVRAIPAETAQGSTTAYYQPGSPVGGISGTYYVNTSKLDQRPLWELPALTAHESVPGHHHQIALQQELDIPDFRRYQAQFTAFVEGWGLYSESLGTEMGIYDTPEKRMGQLSYEMWRACRLVVDTGIHAMGWSKARAVEFMKTNTALTDANIDAEVNRYISNPGQALAYKIGELKIKELRARAETTLGAKFDLRAFHDVVLGQGPVPLDVLETQVDAWIAKMR